MPLAIIPLSPLERGQLNVMRLRGLLSGLALLVPALVIEWVRPEWLPFRGIVLAPVLLAALWVGLVAPGRRWRHWGYAFTGSELHVAHGWWTRVHTIVPVGRVQHVDITQGPIERAFQVSRLVLHTAGTDANIVCLPGVARETAEDIRDAIRTHIGSAA